MRSQMWLFFFLPVSIFDSRLFCLYQSWEAGQYLLRMCITRPIKLNPGRRECGSMNPPRSILKAHSAPWKQALEQLESRQRSGNSSYTTTQKRSSLTARGNPGRKAGDSAKLEGVTVDGVKATDERFQEAFMSDIFHQTSHSDKKKIMPQ